MADACIKGDVNTIRDLASKNRRILFTEDTSTGLSPLQNALKNEDSLNVIIELLDKRYQGFALVNLLHLDSNARLPIENAIRTGSPLHILLKMMAWMENGLPHFNIAGSLSHKKYPMINELLLACILQGKITWAKCAITWGASMEVVLQDKKDQLTGINLDVIAELNKHSTIARGLNRQNKNGIAPMAKTAKTANTTFSTPVECIIEEADPLSSPTLPQKFHSPSANIANHAKKLVQAIIYGDKKTINLTLSNHPKAALHAVPVKQLRKLFLTQEDASDVTNLTALQCACLYHPRFLDEAQKILSAIGDEEGVSQLGRENLVKLKQDIEVARELRIHSGVGLNIKKIR